MHTFTWCCRLLAQAELKCAQSAFQPGMAPWLGPTTMRMFVLRLEVWNCRVQSHHVVSYSGCGQGASQFGAFLRFASCPRERNWPGAWAPGAFFHDAFFFHDALYGLSRLHPGGSQQIL